MVSKNLLESSIEISIIETFEHFDLIFVISIVCCKIWSEILDEKNQIKINEAKNRM